MCLGIMCGMRDREYGNQLGHHTLCSFAVKVWHPILLLIIILFIYGCGDSDDTSIRVDATSPLYGAWVVEEVSEWSTGEAVVVIARTLTFNRDGTFTIHVWHNPDAYSWGKRPKDVEYEGTYLLTSEKFALTLDGEMYQGDLGRLPDVLIVDWGGEGGPTQYNREDK